MGSARSAPPSPERWRIPRQVVFRYETRLDIGVVCHAGLHRARRIDLLTYQVLAALAEAPSGTRELARLTGVDEASMRRRLRDLGQLRFVEQVPD